MSSRYPDKIGIDGNAGNGVTPEIGKEMKEWKDELCGAPKPVFGLIFRQYKKENK